MEIQSPDRRPSLEVPPNVRRPSADGRPTDKRKSLAVPAHASQTKKRRKTFVLCFDGTGNKFSGTESDSNILKIFRGLDRSDPDQFHYYQPGIGTYVSSNDFSSKGRVARMKSAYLKAKDSAIGISFDQHVMGGYKVSDNQSLPRPDTMYCCPGCSVSHGKERCSLVKHIIRKKCSQTCANTVRSSLCGITLPVTTSTSLDFREARTPRDS